MKGYEAADGESTARSPFEVCYGEPGGLCSAVKQREPLLAA